MDYVGLGSARHRNPARTEKIGKWFEKNAGSQVNRKATQSISEV
jgi:hypothetical protein